MQGIRMAKNAQPGSARVPDDFLWADERLIYAIQRETGFDWYWRLYFLLTGMGRRLG
jgi:hypothetical protein